MRIIKVKNYDEMSEIAAQIIAEQLRTKPSSVLGLATGGTPMGTYQRLVEMYRVGKVDFSNVRTFNLDEYCGLEKDHAQSYERFMWEKLFAHVNVARDRSGSFDRKTYAPLVSLRSNTERRLQ